MDDRHNPAPSNLSTMEGRHGTLDTLLADPATDDQGCALVDVFTEYWPDQDGTILYRMSAGPWGRVIRDQDGKWTLVAVDGQSHSGNIADEAILNYLEHRVMTRHPRARKGWNDEYERARHDEMEDVILKLGGTFSKDLGDFRACPQELMMSAIRIAKYSSASWWRSSSTGMGREHADWTSQCIRLLKSRLETLENRWSVNPLPRY